MLYWYYILFKHVVLQYNDYYHAYLPINAYCIILSIIVAVKWLLFYYAWMVNGFFFFLNRLKQQLTNVESTEQEVSWK